MNAKTNFPHCNPSSVWIDREGFQIVVPEDATVCIVEAMSERD
jgi:hypothetical protein